MGRERWTLGRTRRAARRRERRTLRARPWRRLRRKMRGWFGRLVHKLIRGATSLAELCGEWSSTEGEADRVETRGVHAT